MTSSLARLVTEGEVHHQLPMPGVLYGIIAFALFLVALGITWSFRGTAQRIGSNKTTDFGHGPGHH